MSYNSQPNKNHDETRYAFLERKGVVPTTVHERAATRSKYESNTKKPNIAKRVGATAVATIIATGAIIGIQHHEDSVDAAKATELTQVVSASEKLKTVDVENGDTVSSITAEKVKIIAEDGVAQYVATDAAIDHVLGMPENEDALEDGVLGANEKLRVPAKITVELVSGKTASEATSIDVQ